MVSVITLAQGQQAAGHHAGPETQKLCLRKPLPLALIPLGGQRFESHLFAVREGVVSVGGWHVNPGLPFCLWDRCLSRPSVHLLSMVPASSSGN